MAVFERKITTHNVRYFYLNGHLHRQLKVDRHKNMMTAYRYYDESTVMYFLSDVRRDSQQAYTCKQVCDMLNLSKQRLLIYEAEGRIATPERMRKITDNGYHFSKRMWSVDHIIDIHDLMLNTHIGRPRKDGQVTHRSDIPTKAELIAMLKDQEVLYYKDTDGSFQPVWKAPQW